MEKSRIGISVTLASTLVYMCALFGNVPLVICAGYIFAAERNKQLKYHAVRALVFVGFLAVISAVISGTTGLIDMANSFLSSVTSSYRLRFPMDIDRLINNAVTAIRNFGLIYLAIMAYKGKNVESKLFNKYFSDDKTGL
jgi:uncharacterized membrane protein